MIQLYIDGKPAVMKEGSSFKFFRSNIYFTDSEDYTLDVTLPVQGCHENLEIFSAVHRPEMSAVPMIGKKYPFHLISPPLDINGSAVVTEINDKEVKVQLVAGSSVLSYDQTDSIGHDIYIDELDLGRGYDVSFTGTVYQGHSDGSIGKFLDNNPSLLHKVYDPSGESDNCVCFPVYSESSDMVVNIHRYYGYGYSSHYFGVDNGFDKYSAQPYLLLIVERVLNAIGYNLDPDNAIAQSWQRNVFIVNGRNESEYAKILPHWTVSEFLQEVSLFCGVYFTMNGNTISAIRKSDYYAADSEMVYIEDVIDEHTAEIADEEEGSQDARTGNVGYDYATIDPMLQLPEDVWRKAQIIELDVDTDIIAWANAHGIDKSTSRWLFTDMAKDAGKVYAYIKDVDDTWFVCEVDQAGSIIRGDKSRRDVDVSLRIVPAMMKMTPASYRWWWKQVGWDIVPDQQYYAPMLMLEASIDGAADGFNVNDAINPNASEEEESTSTYSKPERIEVAYYDGGERTLGKYSFTKEKDDYSGQMETITDTIVIPLATGIPYVREEGVYFIELFTTTMTHRLLLLKQDVSDGMYHILTKGRKIDTRCRHTFQFLDKGDFSPKDIFLIQGRKYVCEKIEYEMKENGISPLKRGYFYELND